MCTPNSEHRYYWNWDSRSSSDHRYDWKWIKIGFPDDTIFQGSELQVIDP